MMETESDGVLGTDDETMTDETGTDESETPEMVTDGTLKAGAGV
jgi:hypothetical protein